MPSTIQDVLRKVLPKLEATDEKGNAINETLNYNRWKSICGTTFTLDRRMVKTTWDILLDEKVFIPVNGKAVRVDTNRIYDILAMKVS